MTSLRTLELGNNVLTSLTGLGTLTALTSLVLQYNDNLSDIAPIIEVAKSGTLKTVDIDGTKVPCEDVTKLRSSGVDVTSGC
ncbi:MAG: leucine-rich repeat domain-containing protein [Polyangiaceae bacterium]